MDFKSLCITLFINTFYLNLVCASDIELDPNGYILYCPCMGRFGNQADHFLGVLGFSKGLNRTLVLPPWVEYRYGEARSIQIPFDTYFQVDALLKYHQVITMETFMGQLAPNIWPPEKRIAFCFSTRGTSHGCNAKEGNPFGPFWDTFDVDFVGSEFYGPLHYDVYHHDMADKWNKQYTPEEWPVLAFTGAPASFPVQLENRDLHRYLAWSAPVDQQARHFIQTQLPKGAFIGIHLRNGMDWVRACEHIPHSPSLFAAAQCVGYRNEKGQATAEMCLPSQALVVRQLKRIVRNAKNVVALFVASDSNYMIPELTDAFKRMEVSVHRLTPPNPHVELAILGRANFFVGNCISSFSAFVKRERDARGLPSAFWSFPAERTSFGSKHDEL